MNVDRTKTVAMVKTLNHLRFDLTGFVEGLNLTPQQILMLNETDRQIENAQICLRKFLQSVIEG